MAYSKADRDFSDRVHNEAVSVGVYDFILECALGIPRTRHASCDMRPSNLSDDMRLGIDYQLASPSGAYMFNIGERVRDNKFRKYWDITLTQNSFSARKTDMYMAHDLHIFVLMYADKLTAEVSAFFAVDWFRLMQINPTATQYNPRKRQSFIGISINEAIEKGAVFAYYDFWRKVGRAIDVSSDMRYYLLK